MAGFLALMLLNLTMGGSAVSASSLAAVVMATRRAQRMS